MKRLMLAAVLAFGLGGAVRGEITGVPVWDLARDAGELSDRLSREGFLSLDSAHGFEIPSDAVRDLRAFTVEMKVRATKDVQRRQISLLDQMSEGAGWSLGNVRWNVAGNNLLLGLNGTSFEAGDCVIPTNRACSIVLTVREGLVRVYFDGRQVTRFFSEIKPNGAPIRVGNTKLRKRGALKEMSGLRLLSLRFWGADTDYLTDGETRGWADADRGGPGWRVNCPSEDPAKPLPRILCFGDEILDGYGPRLRERLKDKAYVYLWHAFVSSPDGDYLTKYTGFEGACGIARFDGVVFNNGLHALHWTEGNVNDEKVRLTQRAICRSFRQWCPTAKLWWLSTTPQIDARSGRDGRPCEKGPADPIVRRINRISREVMDKEDVPTLDAYAALERRLDLAVGNGDEIRWTERGYDRIVGLVCGALASEGVVSGAGEANGGERPLAYLIDPMIGTVASRLDDNNIHGLGKTFPGAAYPFGIVQLSPDTVTGGDVASGYSYDHRTIEGFSFTHMSGTGWFGDFGNIQVMPMAATGFDRPASAFSHATERAEAGYYRVFLDTPGVLAEATCSAREGMLRFTYPESADSRLTIDFARRVGEVNHPKRFSCQEIEILSPREFQGEIYCDHRDGGWGHGQGNVDYTLYFHATCSKPLEDIERIGGDSNAVLRCRFPTAKDETVTLHVALSYEDIPPKPTGFDFDAMRTAAKRAWTDEIANRIAVEGGTEDERIIFATALYHAMIDPRPVGRGDGFTRRTVFSGWDVFRSHMPLYTIIRPEVVRDTVLSIMDVVKSGESRTLPSWEIFGCNSDCMNGNAIIPVMVLLTEAGVTDFDTKLMYGMAKDTSAIRGNLDCGYMPGELATTLEYCFDDACMAILARRFGTADDVRHFETRAKFYTNCWDRSVGWMRTRTRDGGWLEPWEGRAVHGQGCLESNPWHQGWVVQHDVEGLANLMGGRENFVRELEKFFESTPRDFRWNDAYNHSNKSTQHVPYLFAAAGRPDLTYKWVRRILSGAYGTGVEGLCGNEDEGQMSAWYVLSAVGIHPIAPGDGKWYLTAPLFRKATLKLDPKYATGEAFTVKTHGTYREGCRTRVTLNGRPLDRAYVTTAEIFAGGTVEFIFEAR